MIITLETRTIMATTAKLENSDDQTNVNNFRVTANLYVNS